MNVYEVEFRQLIQNLISNAIKFSKKGIDPEIRIRCEKEEDYCHFSVQDNGIGIDSKYVDRIFFIFQRLHLKEEYEGHGIGLAHCKKIIELHNGRIWVESDSEVGSNFHFIIPNLN
nr:ATP-binding protein [Leptospira interrogans]